MPSVNLKDLFDESRCPFGWNVLPFVFYFPLGVTLAVVRFIIGFHLLLLAQILNEITSCKQFILKLLSRTLGLIVREDCSELRGSNSKAPILVSNHITQLDFLAFHVRTGCFAPRDPKSTMPDALSKLLGFKEMSLGRNTEEYGTQLKGHVQDSNAQPLLLLPEGATTHGRTGLLKFQPRYLGDDAKMIQPVALTLWRPSIIDVSHSVLGSSWWLELFWFFFVPFTVFCIRYLPPVTREENETTDAFTHRIETLISKRLGIQCTKFTVADKRELEKRLFRRPVNRTSPTRAINPELQRMVVQVTEVLPYVPSDVVLKDLLRTRSVDITISNILEGHIPYVPLVPQQQPEPSSSERTETVITSQPKASSSSSLPTIGQSSSLDTSAPVFAKSAQDRSLSFLERKNRLIENARRKYIEKHGIKLAGLST